MRIRVKMSAFYDFKKISFNKKGAYKNDIARKLDFI
jgi:hypothetical protein